MEKKTGKNQKSKGGEEGQHNKSMEGEQQPKQLRVIVRGMRGKLDSKAERMTRVNCTSRSSEEWSKELSPFFLGPVQLYDNHVSQNFENAWQFAKVYQHQVDSKGEPTDEYWKWALAGWNDKKAHRFPQGKGAKPMYSLWKGRHLNYIEARYHIYAPLYAQLVEKTEGFKRLQQELQEKGEICLLDFDGWDHEKLGLELEDVLYYPYKKMGHAFVLAMMLLGRRVWEQEYRPERVQQAIDKVEAATRGEKKPKTAKSKKKSENIDKREQEKQEQKEEEEEEEEEEERKGGEKSKRKRR